MNHDELTNSTGIYLVHTTRPCFEVSARLFSFCRRRHLKYKAEAKPLVIYEDMCFLKAMATVVEVQA